MNKDDILFKFASSLLEEALAHWASKDDNRLERAKWIVIEVFTHFLVEEMDFNKSVRLFNEIKAPASFRKFVSDSLLWWWVEEDEACDAGVKEIHLKFVRHVFPANDLLIEASWGDKIDEL